MIMTIIKTVTVCPIGLKFKWKNVEVTGHPRLTVTCIELKRKTARTWGWVGIIIIIIKQMQFQRVKNETNGMRMSRK